MENEKAIMTNGIPQCPNCKKPTERTTHGFRTRTLMYFLPRYDEKGNNINPDRNTTTSGWRCLACGHTYQTASSGVEECYYK